MLELAAILGISKESPRGIISTVSASEGTTKPFLANHAGFSPHDGVAVRGGDKKTLERPCC